MYCKNSPLSILLSLHYPQMQFLFAQLVFLMLNIKVLAVIKSPNNGKYSFCSLLHLSVVNRYNYNRLYLICCNPLSIHFLLINSLSTLSFILKPHCSVLVMVLNNKSFSLVRFSIWLHRLSKRESILFFFFNN